MAGWVKVKANKTYGRSTDGVEFAAFYGIPYGKPPTGHLRFKRPQPAEPLSGTFRAEKKSISCVQVKKP